MKALTRLESTKAINSLKLKAIKKGGYLKHKDAIMTICKFHLDTFGVDLTPKYFL